MWQISWQNLTMLLATIPSYKTKKPGEPQEEEVEGFDELDEYFQS